MVNYGYACKGWTNEKKKELAQRLRALLVTLGLEKGQGNDGSSPYVEIDGLYDGVRIRRITWLTEERHKTIIKEADKIYDEMNNVF